MAAAFGPIMQCTAAYIVCSRLVWMWCLLEVKLKWPPCYLQRAAAIEGRIAGYCTTKTAPARSSQCSSFEASWNGTTDIYGMHVD